MLITIQEDSGITPKALQTRPRLDKHLQFAWSVFAKLGKRREISANGAQPIAFESFLHHAALYQFSRLDIQEVWETVSLIDELWLEVCAERQAAKAGSEKQAAKKKPPR